MLPLPISIANVREVFDREGRSLDPGAEQLIRGVGTNLLTYIEQNVCPRVTLLNDYAAKDNRCRRRSLRCSRVPEWSGGMMKCRGVFNGA